MVEKDEDKFRLITRSDFDGIASAVLLKKANVINELKFVHPKDVQDGVIEINRNDITTNLPYSPNAHYAFDHHHSEFLRVGSKHNYITDPNAPSATRVVWKMFGGKKSFSDISDDFLNAVDKSDSAKFSIDDILNPQGWDLLSFIMDARTGLGRFKDFRISNLQLMTDLVDMCLELPLEEILNNPDIKERIEVLMEYKEDFKKQLKSCTTMHGNVAFINLLNEQTIYPGNRFMVYALFPDANVSIHNMWRTINKIGVFAVGRSIFNKTNKANIGELMLKYGGGGHKAAGTCQIAVDKMNLVKNDILRVLNDPSNNIK